MTRVRLTPGVIDDLDRIVAHLHHHESDGADARAGEIISALDVLADNPLIGRPADDDKRELVIGRGPQGYIALYRDVPLIDTALVLAIRAHRQGGSAWPRTRPKPIPAPIASTLRCATPAGAYYKDRRSIAK